MDLEFEIIYLFDIMDKVSLLIIATGIVVTKKFISII